MGFMISHRVNNSDLEEGDHVYVYRAGGLYSQHGIFVGGDKVVYFSLNKMIYSGCESSCITSIPSSTAENGGSRVVRTCLNCFMREGSVRRYQYAAGVRDILVKKPGTCTTAKSDPPRAVIRRAKYLLRNGFGNYNLLTNNCEVFALYCKTGLVIAPRQGQPGSVFTIPASVSTASRSLAMLKDAAKALHKILAVEAPLLVSTVALVLVHIGSRYFSDVGLRDDVVRLNVEDLLAFRRHYM